MPRFFNRNGNKISVEYWIDLFEDPDYRCIGQTKVGPFLISTVWLGLDHSFDPEGEPLIFETMVFVTNDERPFRDLECRRYSNETDALLGHDHMVKETTEWEELNDAQYD